MMTLATLAVLAVLAIAAAVVWHLNNQSLALMAKNRDLVAELDRKRRPWPAEFEAGELDEGSDEVEVELCDNDPTYEDNNGRDT